MNGHSPRLLLGNDPLALQTAARACCVAALQAERQAATAGTVLWIAPTFRAQRDVTRRVVADLGSVCLATPVVTFEGFAERLLFAAGHPATAISSTVRRLLLRRITQQLLAEGALQHFRPVVTTSGFLDVVESFISELKRDEVWPETFQQVCSRGRGVRARDRELGLIYERYQTALHEWNWYDTEGRFWLARTELQAGRCRGLPRWRWIGVIGFADFTRTQQEILELLADRTDELVITLPGESDGQRPLLFEKSATAARLLQQTFHQGLQRETVAPLAEETDDRRQLREFLFANPRKITPAQRASAIEIVGCTGIASEITSVALRIKQWLRGGVRPSEIAVGLRSPQEDALRWVAALQQAGLPAWSDVGQPLASVGLLKFLLAILQNELEDWPFARLLSVLGSSYCRPLQESGLFEQDVRSVSRTLRGLRLPQGRDDILHSVRSAVERLSRRPETASDIEPDDVDDTPRDVVSLDDYRRAQRVLDWFDQLTRGLRQRRSLDDWVDSLAEILRKTGALTGLETTAGGDVIVWDQWQRLLRDAAAAEQKYLGSPRTADLSELLAELRDLLAEERCEPSPEPPGCVRILGLDQLRHLETPYLVVAGLTEDSFPRRRGDDCLFSDAERRQLVEQGLPIRHATLHQQDELQFFAHVMLSATRQLVLTYPEINQRGQPAYASPYLSTLRSMWTTSALPIQHEGQLDPIPEPARSVNSTDARLIAMRAATQGALGWLRGLCEAPATQATAANVLAAVEMATHRFETRGFTAYEGRLALPRNQALLAERFHTRRQFSATELESYATCPFRFWLSTVLRVAPLPAAESGTDVMRRGVVVHEVLSQLIHELQPTAALERVARQFQQLVETRLQRELAPSELQRALIRIEQQLLAEWGTAFAGQFGEYVESVQSAWGGPWASAEPEIPFGDVPGDTSGASRAPLELGPPAQRVYVRGRIDRIDTGQIDDQPVFTIIDYKTGSRQAFSNDDVAAGRSLQLVLYALAARRLGFVPEDAVPFQMGYWCLRETGFRSGLKGQRAGKLQALDREVWESLEATLDETIPRLVAGIRQGDFVVENHQETCTSRCDYATVCRVNQVRALSVKLGKIRES